MPKNQQEPRELNLLYLSVLALVVGIGTGYGAVAFRALIGAIHNLFFLGRLSFHYNANVFTMPSPWGAFIILIPVIGAVLVTWLVKTFAPEARGHGVPEVMDAVYYRAGAIRPIVVVIKSLASGLSIGTGGSVGREGPIVQIGSALASTIGGWLRLAPWQRITLVAAGAGGGIAATFNTPLGAVLFAIELMMPEVSVRTFMPVAISTGTATFIGRQYLGFQPAFALPASLPGFGVVALGPLLAYGVLGLIIGLAATFYTRIIYWSEDFFERQIKNQYLRHISGMLVLGIMIYFLFRYFGHYFVEGVGYATVQSILDGQMTTVWLLGLLFVLKLTATSLTLGSGGSGGIFSPALFLGATLGGAIGGLVHALLPGLPDVTIAGFAMVGMAAMVGSATGAAMTAIIMIFEMTRDYDIVMPMILAVAIALGLRRLLSPDNIYTLKLTRRGHYIPQSLHAHMFIIKKAGDVMDGSVLVLPAATAFDDFARRYGFKNKARHIILTEGQRIAGMVSVDDVLRMHAAEPDTDYTFGRLVSRAYILARETDVMFDVIKRMSRRGAAAALVVSADRRVPRGDSVLGVITKEQIADSVADSLTFRTLPGRAQLKAPVE
ncbi:MAG TPA: chloride channel protein [Gammaproteobacteria bacterium]|nr:chloride channel protein [Gammaproteobacteria bacterium]